MPKYITILLSEIISKTDVIGGNIVLSDATEHREGGKGRRWLNELSIAASGYMVIIARLVSVVDNDDENEKGKVKTNFS